MPFFSRQTFTGVAAQQSYTITDIAPILSGEHLLVTVDEIPAVFTYVLATGVFTITSPAIVGGEEIVVQRITPVTEAGRLVRFSDLGHLRQKDLDTMQRQLLANIQEALDGFAEVLRVSTGGSGQWDGMGLRLEDLADGVSLQDAATLGQLNALVIAAGNLPIVNTGNNDWGLFVVAGAWAARTPAQCRVHLGLGSAATLNTGTAAGNVIQLNGSAQYPAADGQLIDLTLHPLTAEVNRRARTTRGLIDRTTEFTPPGVTGTWYENNASRLDPGSLLAVDNGDTDIAVNGGSRYIALTAGTWEMTVTVRARNVDVLGAGNFRTLGFRVTDDVDGPTQATYFSGLDAYSIESEVPNEKPEQFTVTVLLVLGAAKNVVLRLAQTDGLSAELRVSYVATVVRKVL